MAFEYLTNVPLEQAKKDGATVTDDSSAVERLGLAVKLVKGDERNLKITTPEDIFIARMLLEKRMEESTCTK